MASSTVTNSKYLDYEGLSHLKTVLDARYAASSHTHSYLPLSGGTMTGVINSQSIIPTSNSSYNLGSSSKQFNTTYTRYVDTVSGYSLRLKAGGVEHLNMLDGNVNSTANIIPTATDNYNLGSSGYKWNYIYSNKSVANSFIENGEFLSSKYADKTYADYCSSYLHSANRAQFCKPAGVTLEYSTDSGSTWVDYGATDEQKIGFFSGISQGFYLGKKLSTKALASDMLRLTMDATAMGFYTSCKSLLINISTNGSSNFRVKVERSMKGSVDTFTTLIESQTLTGWSGWNRIPIGYAFGGGATQTYNVAKLRLTFMSDGADSSYTSGAHPQVIDMEVLGSTYWGVPHTMAKTGHIYSWDYLGNAIFGKNVTANTFTGNLIGNATSSTTATKIGTYTANDIFVRQSRPDNGFNIDEIELFGMRDIQPSSEITRTGIFPFDGWGSLMSFNGSNYFVQLATQGTSNGLYFRSAYGGGVKLTDKPWVKFLDSSNYSSYALPLAGGTITGLLTIKRSPSAIQFSNSAGTALGYIGINADDDPVAYKADGSTMRHILHSGNYNTYAAAKSHTHTKAQITDFPTSLKNPNALTIQGNGTTLTNGVYDGSAAKTVNITPASIGAAASSHTHTKAQITDFPTSLKNPNKLTLTVGTNSAVEYDGSATKSVSITAESLGLSKVFDYKGVTTTTLTDGSTTKPIVISNVSYTQKVGDVVIVNGDTDKEYFWNGSKWEEMGRTVDLSGYSLTSHTHSNASTSTAGFMSAADKAKLDGIATGANKYTHPSTHAASMITGLSTVATSGSYNDLSNKPTSLKNPYKLTLKVGNNTPIEYDGSSAKTVNIDFAHKQEFIIGANKYAKITGGGIFTAFISVGSTLGSARHMSCWSSYGSGQSMRTNIKHIINGTDIYIDESDTGPIIYIKGYPQQTTIHILCSLSTFTCEELSSLPANVSTTNTNSNNYILAVKSDIPTSLKNPNALTIQGNGTTLTNGVYDGSAAKTVNITPASIGALPLTGGTISSSAFCPLVIERSGSTSMAALRFKNSNGILGSIGMNTVYGSLLLHNADGTSNKTILDSSNYTDYCVTNDVINTLTTGSVETVPTIPTDKIVSSGALRQFWVNVRNIIEDNEFVCASALTDLNTRLDNINTSISLSTSASSAKYAILGSPSISGEINTAYCSSSVYMQDNNIYATSDERLKDFREDIEVDLEKLRKLPKKYFTWKGENIVDIGTSAQELLKLYPELVSYDEVNDIYAVDYVKLSVIALAAVDTLYDRLKATEDRLKVIEDKLAKLS